MTQHNTQEIAELRQEINEHQAEAIELLEGGMYHTVIYEIKNCIGLAEKIVEKIRVIRGE